MEQRSVNSESEVDAREALPESVVALSIVKELLAPEYLTPAQEILFRSVWEGNSYRQTAKMAEYNYDYVRGIGAQIWRMLTIATGKRVSKSNFREVVISFAPQPILELEALTDSVDGKESCDLSGFYGRKSERKELLEWLLIDCTQILTILGLGGIGKTTIALKLIQELEWMNQTESMDLNQHQFSCIICQSLLNPPPLDRLLVELIQTLTVTLRIDIDRIISDDPTPPISQLELLLKICCEYRCLIVLDNYESIFEPGAQVGKYRDEYATYSDLLSAFGQVNHQSCLLLASREKPTEICRLETVNPLIKTFVLPGLDLASGQQIFASWGCIPVLMSEWVEIHNYYGGNPLIFHLLASKVKDIADGDTRELLIHLRAKKLSCVDIKILLEQQCNRLTLVEYQVMYWLAVQREPISIDDLKALLSPLKHQDDQLSTVVESLYSRRILIVMAENCQGWSLQPMVMEYITGKFIEQICNEIELQQPILLNTHPIIQATAPEYIRQTQIRLILESVVQQLRGNMGSTLKIGAHLREILATWRESNPLQPGYVAGNILNLLIYLKLDLAGLDCSDLVIQQAYLADVELLDVNFARAEIVNCTFTQTCGSILSIDHSPDGKTFTTRDSNHKIGIWLADINERYQFIGCSFDPKIKPSMTAKQLWAPNDDLFTAIDYSPDRRTLLTSGFDNTLRLWDATGEVPRSRLVIERDGTPILTVAFSADGRYFAGVGFDLIIRIWQTSNGKCLHSLQGHTQAVQSLAFDPNGERLISGGDDRTIRVWRVSDGKCLQVIRGYTNWFNGIVWSADSSQLITASCDAQIRVWDRFDKLCLHQLAGHHKPAFAVVYDSQGETFASSSDDLTIRLWEANSFGCRYVLHGHTARISILTYSPDGRYLVSGGIDRTIRIWDTQNGRCVKVLSGHIDRICGLVYHADGSDSTAVIISASEDNTIRIWDLHDPKLSRILVQHPHQITTIAFDPKTATLASGSNNQILLWNTNTGKLTETLSGHQSKILSLAYSHNGRWLISGGADHIVKIWSMETFTCIKTLVGHQGSVLSLSISHDDQFLASASQDQTIRLWNVATGSLISTRRCIRPYEGMKVRDIKGLTKLYIDELITLGATKDSSAKTD